MPTKRIRPFFLLLAIGLPLLISCGSDGTGNVAEDAAVQPTTVESDDFAEPSLAAEEGGNEAITAVSPHLYPPSM